MALYSFINWKSSTLLDVQPPNSLIRTLEADPSGLAKFLHKHCSHFEHLVLRLDREHLIVRLPDSAVWGLNHLSNEPLDRWMKTCFTSAQFTKLRELHIDPAFDSGGMDALLSCIQQSQKYTDKFLVIYDRYFELGEVEKIVKVLSSEFRYLRLNVRSLTVQQLFDVLSRLTGLESLSLYIDTTSPVNHVPFQWSMNIYKISRHFLWTS
jgi:hypothetical protein